MSVRKLALSLLVILLLLAIFFAGPRVKIDPTIHPLTLGDDIERYINHSESAYDDIIPGTEKKIIWQGQAGDITPLSIVYIHGFTASRQESAPLANLVASKLGANLFYTRLTGHGRGTEGMMNTSVNAWLNDANEALEIGRRIGQRVVVMGMSAGGALAFWLSTQPHAQDAAAFVLISPAFKILDPSSSILLWPWGQQIAELVAGKVRCRQASNPAHERYWTNCHPTRSVMTLKGMVGYVRSLDFNAVQRPMLMIISPEDQVVNAHEAVSIFDSIGSDIKELVEYYDTEDPAHHILAGDVLSPNSTQPMANIIVNFIETVD